MSRVVFERGHQLRIGLFDLLLPGLLDFPLPLALNEVMTHSHVTDTVVSPVRAVHMNTVIRKQTEFAKTAMPEPEATAAPDAAADVCAGYGLRVRQLT